MLFIHRTLKTKLTKRILWILRTRIISCYFCQNCHDYIILKIRLYVTHTSYRGYPSCSVKCGASHPSFLCTKSRETPKMVIILLVIKNVKSIRKMINLQKLAKNKRQLPPTTTQSIEHQNKTNYTFVNSKLTFSSIENPPLSNFYANAVSK